MSDHPHRRAEADLLARIGQCLFAQDLRVRVQLPASLAAGAIEAWERDDRWTETESESPVARTGRNQAGHLALIGFTLSDREAPIVGDTIEVELDAWQIGSALDAAEERGLLRGVRPFNDTV